MRGTRLRSRMMLGFAAATLLAIQGTANADLVVDNFENTNIASTASANARPWGGTAQWRALPEGLGAIGANAWRNGTIGREFKLRTTGDAAVGANNAYNLQIIPNHAGGNAVLFGDGGGGQSPSGATNPDRAIQLLGKQLVRTASDFNATDYQYLRFTSWYTQVPAKSEARFAVMLGQEPTSTGGFLATNHPPRYAVGPWEDENATEFGVQLTTEPTVFVIPIKNTDHFRNSPAYDDIVLAVASGMSGLPSSLEINDWTDIRILQFWVYVQGAAAQSGVLGGRFATDDIMFLQNFPEIEISEDTLTVTKGGAPESFDISLTAMPSHDVTITFPAGQGLTFVPSSVTFTPSNWATPQTVDAYADCGAFEAPYLEVYQPGVDSDDLWYSDPNNAPAPINFTIESSTDPVASFAALSSTVNEGDGTALIQVSLDQPSPGLTIDLGVVGGNAASGTDYNLPGTTVTIPLGETSANFTIDIVDNALWQPATRTLEIGIVAGSGYLVCDSSAHVLTIEDNNFPAVNFATATSNIGEGDGTATINLALEGPFASDLDVTLGVNVASTAVENDDYTLATTTVTFDAGETTASFEVTIIDNALDQDDRTLVLEINPGAGYVAGATALQTLTIEDNDDPAGIAPTTGTVVVSETDNQVIVAVGLSEPSGKTITIDYATQDDTATAGVNYVATSGTLTFDPGETSQQITINLIDSSTRSADTVEFSVVLSNATNADLDPQDSEITITIELVTSVNDWMILND